MTITATPPRRPLIVASFDPSSTAIGYAKHLANVSHNVEPELLDAGTIRPARPRDAPEVRIEQMVREAVAWLTAEHPLPDEVVIEITTGKVHRGKAATRGAGLGVYGMAVGWLLGVTKARAGLGYTVKTYRENVWTGGERKEMRNLKCEALHPGRYKMADDPGGDCGDAIMLGRFHCFARLYERTDGK